VYLDFVNKQCATACAKRSNSPGSRHHPEVRTAPVDLDLQLKICMRASTITLPQALTNDKSIMRSLWVVCRRKARRVPTKNTGRDTRRRRRLAHEADRSLRKCRGCTRFGNAAIDAASRGAFFFSGRNVKHDRIASFQPESCDIPAHPPC
jgi:hypothetical protein